MYFPDTLKLLTTVMCKSYKYRRGSAERHMSVSFFGENQGNIETDDTGA